ncbi:uncharacterized protein METZ01_LOCUS516605, partial [marine metagenome]
RASNGPVRSMGDSLDVMVPLNQDTMDRHLGVMPSGSSVIYDEAKITPENTPEGVQLCPLPIKELIVGNKLAANTVAVAVILNMLGIEFDDLVDALERIFSRKGKAVVESNMEIAQRGYDYAADNFSAFPYKAPRLSKGLAVVTGNEATGMGALAAGVKFYAAYPMSPSTGVLMYIAQHARELGVMVRQVEDEIGVMNMVIGAAHAGCRAMCATSGGGFALMTEAIGMS